MDEDERDINSGGPTSSLSTEDWFAKRLKETEKEIKGVTEQTEDVVQRISHLLLQYSSQRVSSTDSFIMWCLRLLEVELSGLSELLRELLLSDLSPDYIDFRISDWLGFLSTLAMHLGSELDNQEQAGAIGCFCPSTTRLPFSDIFKVKGYLRDISSLTESPCRYKHLLLADEDGDLTHTSRMANSFQPQLHVETDASSLLLVGIESTLRNKVLRWFMDDQEDITLTLKFISMVGPVGVGKTAIAREMYRRLQSRGGDEGKLLCCITAKVSRRTDVKEVLLHILSQINKPAALALASTDELELVVQKISQFLQDRRYLIMVDDIWKISDWDIMKNAFPRNTRGSRIVITTRIRSIARECCSYFEGFVHEVKSLGEVDSRMLLFRKPFGCEVDQPPENFRHVCSEILRRCEGIPLFINGMADWLQQQKQKQQQQYMQHISNYSMEETPQMLKCFEQALSHTYDDLSYEMKLMVLYMNMFPEGYIFGIDTLQSRRTDDSFGVPSDIVRLFSELTDRNIITPVTNWKGTPLLEEDCHYKVNYYMLQFLASKSADKGFVCTSGWLSSVARNKDNDKLRWISLHQPDPDLECFLKTRDFLHTHSLAISGSLDGIPLEKFIHLIVLDLEGWQQLKDKDLSVICNSGLFLLKHFVLRRTKVSRLPPEIKKLLMLNTLVASHTLISELPSEVGELQELSSLDLRNTQITQLPEHIWMVPKLRTLLVGGNGVNCDPTITEVPEGTWFQSVLSTLETVDLSQCSAGLVEALGRIENLKVLCIRWSFRQCTDAILQEALCSSIERWRCLQSLTIQCGLGCPMKFLAYRPNPFPCVDLEKFKVTGGRFVSLPRWFDGLERLASIEITVCRLEHDDLKMLARMHSLKCLILGLHFVPEEGIVIYGEGFHGLERLSVCCRVPWLAFHLGAMPLLSYLELKIGGGPGIKERIPSELGNLSSLRELAIYYNAWYTNNSNVKNIVEAVTKGVAEHHNPINLVINGNQYEEEYVERAGDGVPFIDRIQDQNEIHHEAEEDAATATGSQSKIEVVVAPDLNNQSPASQDSRWYPEDGH